MEQPKQIVLEKLISFLGVDFTLKAKMMAIPLNHVGLEIHKSKRKEGGIKKLKEFYHPNGELAVSLEFKDSKKVPDLNEEGIQKKDEKGNDLFKFVDSEISENPEYIKEHKKYFYDDGTVFCENIFYKKVNNVKELKKSRAKHSFNYLADTADQLGASEAVNRIFDHFEKAVNKWLTLGDSKDFEEGIKNLSQSEFPVVYGTIKAEIPGFSPKTFEDAIVEQLTGIKYE